MRRAIRVLVLGGLAIILLWVSGAQNAPVFGVGETRPSIESTTARSQTDQLAFRAPIDPLPPDSLDPLSRTKVDLSQLFPGTFGGFRSSIDPEYVMTVLEVGSPDPALEAEAAKRFEGLGETFGTRPAQSTGRPVRIRFEIVRFSYVELERIRIDISTHLLAEDNPELADVFASGLDEAGNRAVVVMQKSGNTEAVAKTMNDHYGPGRVGIMVGDIPIGMGNGRVADSPPWNGGDMIINQNISSSCTSGFGVHSTSTGHKYNLTAGHCRSGTWYNKAVGDPNWNASAKLGSTVPGSLILGLGNTAATPTLDAQLLDNSPNTSSCISWGAISVPPFSGLTRIYLSGYNNPGSSMPVMSEGAFGFELPSPPPGHVLVSGVTYESGFSWTSQKAWVINGFIVDFPFVSGDSGGPIIQPSAFGPLAAGMISSSDGVLGYGQLINSLRYSYQVDVNVSTTGTSC